MECKLKTRAKPKDTVLKRHDMTLMNNNMQPTVIWELTETRIDTISSTSSIRPIVVKDEGSTASKLAVVD